MCFRECLFFLVFDLKKCFDIIYKGKNSLLCFKECYIFCDLNCLLMLLTCKRENNVVYKLDHQLIIKASGF